MGKGGVKSLRHHIKERCGTFAQIFAKKNIKKSKRQLGRVIMENKKFAAAYADAIIEQLWLKGFISEEQRDRLYGKNPYREV